MNLVDVHCHLNHQFFKTEVEEIIKRSITAGVKAIVISGVNPPANREVLKLVETYNKKHKNILKPCLGLYPIDTLGLSEGETGLPRQTVPINMEEEFAFIKKNKDKIVGVGEVGLDFFWDKEHHEEQKENFRKIINFTKSIQKPIIIHSRKAEAECVEILSAEITDKEIPVVMHCFSGNKKLIIKARDLGYYFSIPPIIVKLQHFQILVEMVPLTQLLTETDAPWLSPFSDKRNEPAFVMETIKKIAEIKKLSEEEVAGQIWDNYESVFGKE